MSENTGRKLNLPILFFTFIFFHALFFYPHRYLKQKKTEFSIYVRLVKFPLCVIVFIIIMIAVTQKMRTYSSISVPQLVWV